MVRTKQELREEIWRRMEELHVARFPGAFGRIPNFTGAEKAALRLTRLEEWRRTSVVKVNPDSPQAPVRRLALLNNITVIMPTPRLREGFLLLDPGSIDREDYGFASTIKGAFALGRKINPADLPKVDLVVVGSVAVNEQGERIGKGGGYSEIEWAVAREFGKVEENTLIATTIHDVQLVKELFEIDPYDLQVDCVATPTLTLRVKRNREKPRGIYWSLIQPEKIREIPILQEMFKRGKLSTRSGASDGQRSALQ
ncbi:MAG: 5-formyltetrahydrofolate cyclo-ligase [Candidatus Brockarchaeota archaeon]|nr:5-formyltetrahydrofolate cyclo-ligase [Candidatus Brockarchaeota archaeon]MBO3808879.1 5-formyltetrahydrofolate cyclo-ligase [Candidatus Brockarchaeota archaeon]